MGNEKGYIRVFDDKQKLREMLALYSQGFALFELGKKYGVDHTSILYQVKKNGAYNKEKKRIEKEKKETEKINKKLLKQTNPVKSEIRKVVKDKNNLYKKLSTEKCFMNYEDYIFEEERKRLNRIAKCEHKIWIKRCSCCGKILENT